MPNDSPPVDMNKSMKNRNDVDLRDVIDMKVQEDEIVKKYKSRKVQKKKKKNKKLFIGLKGDSTIDNFIVDSLMTGIVFTSKHSVRHVEIKSFGIHRVFISISNLLEHRKVLVVTYLMIINNSIKIRTPKKILPSRPSTKSNLVPSILTFKKIKLMNIMNF
jgi:hypothetical protein